MGTGKPKYIDTLTFNKWTNENCWALGILIADGNFAKSRPNEWSMNSTELDDLIAFQKVFKSDKEPYQMKPHPSRYGSKLMYRITLSNPTIAGFLKSINAYGTKDERNPFKHIPDEFKWAFIKGLFDGDGNCTRGCFQIAGREELITEVYYWICKQIYKEPNKIHQTTSSSRTKFFLFSKSDTITVTKLLEQHTKGTYNSNKYKKLLSYV